MKYATEIVYLLRSHQFIKIHSSDGPKLFNVRHIDGKYQPIDTTALHVMLIMWQSHYTNMRQSELHHLLLELIASIEKAPD